MTKTIFREVSFIEYSLNEPKNLDALYHERVTVFGRLKDFLIGGSYTSYRHKDEFLKAMLSESIPYGMEDKVIASRVGISENAVRLSRVRMSEDAFSKVGRDIVQKILLGDSQVLKQLNQDFDVLKCGTSMNSWFPFEYSEIIRNTDFPPHEDFELPACSAELETLYAFSLPNFRKLLADDVIDCDKMGFLLRVLGDSNSPKYSEVMRLVFGGKC
jgi:hypothetical protein